MFVAIMACDIAPRAIASHSWRHSAERISSHTTHRSWRSRTI